MRPGEIRVFLHSDPLASGGKELAVPRLAQRSCSVGNAEAWRSLEGKAGRASALYRLNSKPATQPAVSGEWRTTRTKQHGHGLNILPALGFVPLFLNNSGLLHSDCTCTRRGKCHALPVAKQPSGFGPLVA